MHLPQESSRNSKEILHQEIWSLKELSTEFSLDDIHRKPAIVNEAKLLWMNRCLFRNKLNDEASLDKLAQELQVAVGDSFK